MIVLKNVTFKLSQQIWGSTIKADTKKDSTGKSTSENAGVEQSKTIMENSRLSVIENKKKLLYN